MKSKTLLFFRICLLLSLFIQVDKLFPQDIKEADILQKEADTKILATQWNYQSIRTSINKYVEISKLWKNINKSAKSASVLRDAGRLSVILGEKQNAEIFFNEALKLLEIEPNDEEKSKILSEFSLLKTDEGEMNESKKNFEEALFLAEQKNSPLALAMSYYSAGFYFEFKKETDLSVNSYRKSVEFCRISGDLACEAKSLWSLGYALIEKQEYDDALEYMNLSLSKARQTNDIRSQSFALRSIGGVYNIINQKQKALNFYYESEKLFPNDVDFFEQGILYNGLGSIYEYYKDWNSSLIYREKALASYKKAGNLFAQLYTLISLGRLNLYLDNRQLGFKYLTESEQLAIKLEDFFNMAVINENLGDYYVQEKKYNQALLHYQKSLNLLNKRFPRQISRVLIKIGKIYDELDSSSLSRKYYLQALDFNLKVKDNSAQSEIFYNLALTDYKEKNYTTAFASAKDFISLTETESSDVSNSKLRISYFSNIFDRYELFINLLMKMQKENPDKDFALQALQSSEKSRARSMLEKLALSEAEFRPDVDSDADVVKREKEIRVLLNAKSDKLTDLLSANAEKPETDKVSSEINELEHQLEEIKAQLKQNSPIYSAIKNPAPFDLAEFQQNILDEDSLFLEFSFGKDESFLWLVGKNEFHAFYLPPREIIETKIENLRLLSQSREMKPDEKIEDYQTRIAQAEKEYFVQSKELSDMLFGQIADKLQNKRLIIAPDGKLHYFPVSALPRPNSESNEPIILTNEIVYQPSAQTLSLLAKMKKQTSAQKDLLVFSDPVFSKDDERLSGVNLQVQTSENDQDSFRFVESLENLPRLTASKTEADSIAEIVGKSNTEFYSGFSANRNNFLNPNLKDYKILHLATHGIANEQRPELSGIVLSRFDETGQNADEFVRLQDIYGLNLNADLVVLSACETGVGKEVRGEGLQSLNNAFLSVGAKSVLSSLWKVEDGATVELMKIFYQAMADEQISPSKALQKAQIQMLQNERYKSPFYWAAFTVQGDFQNAPKISKPNYLMYLLPILVVLGIGIYFFRRRFYSTVKL